MAIVVVTSLTTSGNTIRAMIMCVRVPVVVALYLFWLLLQLLVVLCCCNLSLTIRDDDVEEGYDGGEDEYDDGR